mgnify:CR=1 FL=1
MHTPQHEGMHLHSRDTIICIVIFCAIDVFACLFRNRLQLEVQTSWQCLNFINLDHNHNSNANLNMDQLMPLGFLVLSRYHLQRIVMSRDNTHSTHFSFSYPFVFVFILMSTHYSQEKNKFC